MEKNVTTEVERVARDSYGRLVAFLTMHFQDVTAAEDALGDAFESALKKWSREGLPDNPEGWLFAVAKRRMIDGLRREKTREMKLPELQDWFNAEDNDDSDKGPFQDHRINLMFACAHPAIDSSIRAPLILNTILHLSAEQMAAAFLAKPRAMGQRLVRGKRKIRDAGIGFELPTEADLPARLDFVLEAVYAAFGVAWEEMIVGGNEIARDLSEESIWITRLIVEHLPDQPEPRGLLALMLYCDARKEARRDEADGRFIPLSEQDPQLWERNKIEEAEHLLEGASKMKHVGRFQLEASIQSAHSVRISGRKPNWDAIVVLYEGLVRLAPTIGAWVSRASALAEVKGPEFALAELDRLPSKTVADYQPFWALKAHLLEGLSRFKEAGTARNRAAGLTTDPSVRAFLLKAR